MENDKEQKNFKIVVNGEEEIVSKERLTFAEVLDLAFPPPRTTPDKDYSITYKHAKSVPHHGQLHLGGVVEVKNGTSFDVTPTTKS